jgi:hypothetical protein
MPINFRHLGLIRIAFPEARILHIRRDPLDTCLSIYMTYFAGGPTFAYNRTNIVAYYRAYLGLMEHWRSVLPSSHFHELRYEDLVSDPEATARAAIEFCGLPWEEACLRFHQSSRVVGTPSRWQARQPVYKSSVGRWRNYEPWLAEFLALSNIPAGS